MLRREFRFWPLRVGWKVVELTELKTKASISSGELRITWYCLRQSRKFEISRLNTFPIVLWYVLKSASNLTGSMSLSQPVSV